MRTFRIISILLIAVLIIPVDFSYSREKPNFQHKIMQDDNDGEVINVNYEYAIVFADKKNNDLAEGMIVKVFEERKFIAHLSIIDVSEVMIKLGPVSSGEFRTTEDEFEKITGFLTGMQFLTWFVGIATLIAGVFAIGGILLIFTFKLCVCQYTIINV